MRTILIIHAGGLGDVLLAVPSMRALRSAFPEHRIGLLAGSEVGSILKMTGEIHELFPLEHGGFTSLLAGHRKVTPPLREWLAHCDVAVGWMNDPDGTLRAAFNAFGIKHVIVESANAALVCSHLLVHQSDRLLHSLKTLVGRHEGSAVFSLPPSVIADGKRLLAENGLDEARPLVGIHPGSGSAHKCCPPEVLSEVLRGLEKDGHVPVVFEGPADEEIVRRLLKTCPHPLVRIRKLPIVSVAALLSHMKLFIGHDSGLSHLAAALGVPTVTLFGPTDPRRWGPRGPHVRVVTGDRCHCEGWNEVQACREKPCLRIPSNEVLSACRQLQSVILAPSPSPCSDPAVMLQSPATFSLN